MQIGKSTIPERVSDPALAEANGPAPVVGQGAGFDRLVAAAQAEANRRQALAARTGANDDGFTDHAWFDAIKRHGATIGLGAYANAIKSDGRGQYLVSDSAMRQKILAARNDPNVRAMMAVKRAGESRVALTKELGRAPTDQEMRAADVLGARTAAKLILTRQGTPLSSAAIAVPEAAEANHGLFYRPDGSPLTVNDVLQRVMSPTPQAATATGVPGVAPSAVTPGQPMPPDVMRALQSQANFASAGAQNPAAPQAHRPAPTPPNLALVGGTIGNLSMPGMTKGTVGATGGQLGGWRGQMSSEVMTQITQPQRTVQNLPSNVTIPAPQPTRYMAANEVHRDVSAAPTVAQSSTSLGPDLAGQQTATVSEPSPASLPSLILDGQSRSQRQMPGDALALLPVGQQPPGVPAQGAGTPQTLAPLQGQATSPPEPQQVATPQAEATPERPSRYGPGLRQGVGPQQTASALNYAPSPDVQSNTPAAAAGIRPSRYYANPASAAAQQYAAMSRMAAPQVAQPAVSVPLDANGNAILPPVPGPNALPPLTAAEALRAGPVQVTGPVPPRSIGPSAAERAAALDGTKPLDLSPDAPALAAAEVPIIVASQQPQQQASRVKPRTTPPFMFGR